jgi:hypothetical protein
MSIAALTTAFVPSSSCLASDNIWKVFTTCPGNDQCYYLLQGPPSTSDCLPTAYRIDSTAYYSPAHCPSGYTPACSSLNTINHFTETVYTCCPTYAHPRRFILLREKALIIRKYIGYTLSAALPLTNLTSGPSNRVSAADHSLPGQEPYKSPRQTVSLRLWLWRRMIKTAVSTHSLYKCASSLRTSSPRLAHQGQPA